MSKIRKISQICAALVLATSLSVIALQTAQASSILHFNHDLYIDHHGGHVVHYGWQFVHHSGHYRHH